MKEISREKKIFTRKQRELNFLSPFFESFVKLIQLSLPLSLILKLYINSNFVMFPSKVAVRGVHVFLL